MNFFSNITSNCSLSFNFKCSALYLDVLKCNCMNNCFGYVDIDGDKVEGEWKNGKLVYDFFSDY